MSWPLLPVQEPFYTQLCVEGLKDTVLCPQTKYLSWAFSWEPSKLTGEGDDVPKKSLQEAGKSFPAISFYMDCQISDLICLHNISKTNSQGLFSLGDYF